MTKTLPFGLWVKEARKMLDLTQKDLADLIGCSTITVKQIEAETRRPSKQLLELLAANLRIPSAQRTQFVVLGRGGSGKQSVFLPQQWTPFVGRENELAKIRELLQNTSRCRLLTLVGPGGIGKTRLAIEAAGTLLENFVDGVIFVPLAGIRGCTKSLRAPKT
jgi:transcriptional regulator with XRE-family HTH domain